jgi:dUTP pyrophosphatase
LNRVAQFEKCSMSEISQKDITIPKRGTKGSAGYDFIAPFDFSVPYGSSVIIPTGIKVQIDDGWFLAIVPRSGQGFKYGIEIANTFGVIDSDYYNNPNNEGEIFVKIVNKDITTQKTFSVNKGTAFCQGIFLPYGILKDDKQEQGDRIGGFGSTDNTGG